MPGVLKQSTGPTSFSVQLEDGRPLRRHQGHLIPRSSVIQEPIVDQEVPPPQAAEQPELQPEEPLTQPTEPVQSAPQEIPEKRYPTRTDKPLDIWLILLLSDLCYSTKTLKNCNLSFVVDVIVIVSIA